MSGAKSKLTRKPVYANHAQNVSYPFGRQLSVHYTEAGANVRPESNPLILIFRHAWLLFIVVTCVNGAVWWRRAQPGIAENPALGQGYRRLIKSWFIYGNLPWLVMAAGILSGAVPSTLSYFNPRNGPFVIAFYVTVVTLWIATFYWLFFRGGAEDLLAHPGLLNLPVARPWAVKAYFLLCLAGGVVGLLWMIFADIQVPFAR